MGEDHIFLAGLCYGDVRGITGGGLKDNKIGLFSRFSQTHEGAQADPHPMGIQERPARNARSFIKVPGRPILTIAPLAVARKVRREIGVSFGMALVPFIGIQYPEDRCSSVPGKFPFAWFTSW
jgi:hypothetical protein